jgi:uncharacterized protein YdhG (YjbR/CyaY superfamily)
MSDLVLIHIFNTLEKFKKVDEHIQAFPKNVQVILEKIREIIKENAPEAVETISYGMPAYKLNGKVLVYFSGWDKHIGFYALPSGNRAFAKELEKYKVGKGSIQFSLDKPIPYDLIKKIVKFRLAEIQG